MAEQRVSKDAFRAMAGLSGLELTDDELEELLPQVQRTFEGMVGLDVLNLGDVEPAISFKAEEE
jgi:Asp-tRNA(Asn)/Glu-tRNA(Gln) amidotransferase C subunit